MLCGTNTTQKVIFLLSSLTNRHKKKLSLFTEEIGRRDIKSLTRGRGPELLKILGLSCGRYEGKVRRLPRFLSNSTNVGIRLTYCFTVLAAAPTGSFTVHCALVSLLLHSYFTSCHSNCSPEWDLAEIQNRWFEFILLGVGLHPLPPRCWQL